MFAQIWTIFLIISTTLAAASLIHKGVKGLKDLEIDIYRWFTFFPQIRPYVNRSSTKRIRGIRAIIAGLVYTIVGAFLLLLMMLIIFSILSIRSINLFGELHP